MSNGGQAALTVVGTIVGAYFGYPQLGFVLGSLAGQALFPTQLPPTTGPRLGDGQQTVSTVGQPIPWIHGTQMCGANIIWASPIREVAETDTAGGKGGAEQEQTTYRYYRSFAILICEGPIAGIRKIKANGKEVFNRQNTTGLTLEELLELSPYDEFFLRFYNQNVLSNSYASKITIYLGTEDQMPDPVIESFEGVGNVPAHRGYAYVVFDDVELRAEDGFRIPAQWKFEVYEDGDTDTADTGFYAQEVLHDWLNETDPRDPRNTHGLFMVVDGDVYTATQPPFGGDPLPAMLQSAYTQTGLDRRLLHAIQVELSDGAFANIEQHDGPTPAESQDAISLLYRFTTRLPGLYPWPTASEEPTCANMYNEGTYYYGVRPPTSNGALHYVSGQPSEPDQPMIPGWSGRISCDSWVYYIEDLGINVTRSPAPPAAPCELGRAIPNVEACVYRGVIYPSDAVWVREEGELYNVLQSFVGDYPDDGGVKYPLGPALPVGHPQDTEAFWTSAYNSARAAGQRIAAGLVYGVDYPVQQNFGYRLSVPLADVEVFPVSLATICARVCDRVAERTGTFLYDVEDLEDIYIIGTQFSRPMTARAMIEPLRSVGFFDVVEDGIQLKFVTRGKAPVATLEESDLGARMIGEQRVSLVTTERIDELQLPRQIRVHYQDHERDYDPGEEFSPSRFDTKAESVVDIDLGVAITPDHAAQIAEVVHRDTWASRYLHRIQLDSEFNGLQPADVLIIPIDGENHRVRIPSFLDRPPYMRIIDLVRDDDGAYVSTAVGQPRVTFPINPMPLYGPVEVLLLDIPALDPLHNDAGVYAAVQPLVFGGDFRGANISRSVDNGSTFQIIGSVSESQVMGLVREVVLPGITTIFDEVNSIVVQLDYEGDELPNATDAGMLQGANLCAIGAHGRWELFQYGSAVEELPGFWRISHLLRGRRGTEHVMGSSQVGDRFVLLDDVARIPMTVPEIGAERIYIATPTGTQLASDPIEFTTTGEALRPFSPVHIEGERDDDGNLTIDFIRRDRLATDIDEAMSEEYEDYEIDILDDAGEVRRTISTSTTNAIYSDEQQLADFGELRASVPVAVYQISVAVGRGAAGRATL